MLGFHPRLDRFYDWLSKELQGHFNTFFTRFSNINFFISTIFSIFIYNIKQQHMNKTKIKAMFEAIEKKVNPKYTRVETHYIDGIELYARSVLTGQLDKNFIKIHEDGNYYYWSFLKEEYIHFTENELEIIVELIF